MKLHLSAQRLRPRKIRVPGFEETSVVRRVTAANPRYKAKERPRIRKETRIFSREALKPRKETPKVKESPRKLAAQSDAPGSQPNPYHNFIAWKLPRARRSPLNEYVCFALYPKRDPEREQLLDRQPHEDSTEPSKVMLNFLEILSTPTADTGASLLLHCENRRYIFGHVSEGTQRELVQRKMSARNIEDIFLTGTVNWQNTGGLLGLVLTIGDASAGARAAAKEDNERRAAKGQKLKPGSFSSLNIHGPMNLTHMLASARKFVFRQGLPLRPHEIRSDHRTSNSSTWEPDWQDGNIRVWNVPINHYTIPTKKRSYDAINDSTTKVDRAKLVSEKEGQKGPDLEEDLQEDADHQIRTNAVREMFDSNWKLDTLVEVSLRDVKLPATVFTRDKQGHITEYSGPLPGGDDPVPEIKVLVRTPWPSSAIDKLPRASKSVVAMSYIVKNQPRRGRFRVDEAKRFGVATVDFKRLTAGECVPGKDGLVVAPEMVVEPTIEGRGFIVVDLPHVSYIEGFLARPEWSSKDIMSHIEAMYWIVEQDKVLEDSRIQSFMRQKSGMKHIILSPTACSNRLTMTSATSETIKLNIIDPDRFPIPAYSNEPNHPPTFGNLEFQTGQPGAVLQLAPHVRFQDDKVVPCLDTAKVVKEIQHDAKVLALADTARAELSDPAFLSTVAEANKDTPNLDVEIIALGTGSALPSKNRNVSATLIRVPGHGNYLLDCGENTLGQLRRLYGFDGADDIVKNLRAIYISHLHADHHLGTVSVIRHYRDLYPSPDNRAPLLGLIAPGSFWGFLLEYSDMEFVHGPFVEHISTSHQPLSRITKSSRLVDPSASLRIGLSRIDMCSVDHCMESTAVVLTLPSGLRIAYSGDCRPSREFATLGRGAHVLIHECTFDDELAGDAHAKKHCTMSDALWVAREMRASRVLMTHFSQRYPKIPVINERGAGKQSPLVRGGDNWDDSAADHDMSVLFAFDYMCVKVGDFKKAEKFLPAIQKLYNDEDDE